MSEEAVNAGWLESAASRRRRRMRGGGVLIVPTLERCPAAASQMPARQQRQSGHGLARSLASRRGDAEIDEDRADLSLHACTYQCGSRADINILSAPRCGTDEERAGEECGLRALRQGKANRVMRRARPRDDYRLVASRSKPKLGKSSFGRPILAARLKSNVTENEYLLQQYRRSAGVVCKYPRQAARRR